MTAKHQVQPGETLWGLAERYYGDGRRHRVIAVFNQLSDPDHIVAGQELEIPDVTYRYRVKHGDTKATLAQQFYGDATLSTVFEIPNGAAQRDLVVGEWLLIPDLNDVGHHTVVGDETLPVLAERWYGEAGLWPVIAIANDRTEPDPDPGTVLIRPGLNRRRAAVRGDTLWRLTADHYGDYGEGRTLTLTRLVAAANLIDDPDRLAVGQVIYFPDLWP